MSHISNQIRKASLFSLLSFFFMVFSGFATAKEADQTDSSLERVQKNSVLRVCSDAGFLPFEMRTSSGDWAGFDVDMMQSFAKSLHVKLEMIQINFDGIIPALIAGKCDLIASAMTVTPERQKVVNFSDVTYENSLSIALKNTKENQVKYKNLESLDKENIKIAVRTGSTSDIYLSKQLKNAKILRFDQDADLSLAVSQSKANAFVYDSNYIKIMNKSAAEKFLVVPTSYTTEKLSVAGRKQDKVLMQKFNVFLKSWKSDGSYKKTESKYFDTK